jgi:hypothetical protein
MTTSTEDPRAVLQVHGVTLEGFHGPLPVGSSFELRLDDAALTLSGGQPPVAWQVPASATEGLASRRRADRIELTGWIAGGYGMLTIPLGVQQESAEAIMARLEGFGARVATTRPPRRRWPWVLGIVVVAGIAGLVTGLVVSSSSTSPAAKVTAEQRGETMAKNLVLSDLPSGWQRDDPSVAPLGGLLSVSSSGKESATEKHASSVVIGEFQSCMGLTNAQDRTFGAAGVQPIYQIGGAPLGLVSTNQELEVGSATQLYASDADVEADLTQLRSPKFPACFAEALGRLLEISVDPSMATASLQESTQSLPASLGTYTAGSNVELPVKGSSAPIEIGVTEIIHAPYEQTLFTYSAPGTFSPALRAQLVSILAGRLVGSGGAAAT